jgi:hypothetical protein
MVNVDMSNACILHALRLRKLKEVGTNKSADNVATPSTSSDSKLTDYSKTAAGRPPLRVFSSN